MNQLNLLQKPILSEKAYKDMEKGVYTFFVDNSADKKTIAKIISDQFSVDVEKVNISKVASKMKKITGTRKQTVVGGGKKAIVYLKKGQKISALSPKAPPKSKTAKGSKEKDVQKVIAEGKEG